MQLGRSRRASAPRRCGRATAPDRGHWAYLRPLFLLSFASSILAARSEAMNHGSGVTAPQRIDLATDVLVIGSGAAGMSAAIAADEADAEVLLVDRSLIGRGGATVMAQMTVAVALGEEMPDDPAHHYADTIAAGRGLCDEALAELLCEDAPDCIRELDAWGVGWARKNGHITATTAPGHDRPRCVYVDFINTGPAVSKTLRTQMARNPNIRKLGDLCIVDLAVSDGEAIGAVGWH